jgi:hypothetical protein
MRGTSRNSYWLAKAVLVTAGSILAAACSADRLLPPTQTVAARPASDGASTDVAEADQNQILATIREATARYHRVEAAIADGYVQGSPCESMPGQGIGIHFRKSSLFNAIVDPSQPELLVYEPQSNGDISLVAVAFVVPSAAWDPTHNSPPMLGDQVFEDKRTPDWSSPPFPNYELHVWVWKENPNGMYATTNPKVSCDP